MLTREELERIIHFEMSPCGDHRSMIMAHDAEQRAKIERLREMESEYNALIQVMHKRGAELCEKLGYIPDMPDEVVRVFSEVDTQRARIAELEAVNAKLRDVSLEVCEDACQSCRACNSGMDGDCDECAIQELKTLAQEGAE